MTITIIAVHPSVTIVRDGDRQLELPVAWFPTPPQVGQEWTLDLHRQPTETEQLQQLNAYLARD